MCSECRARGVAGAQFDAQYMVRNLGKPGVRGPLGRDEVIRGIAKNRYGPDDRISAVGGAETAIAEHPEFRAAFIPGSEMDRQIEKVREELSQVLQRAKRKQLLNTGFAAALFGMAGGLMWLSAGSRLLVMPSWMMDRVEEQVTWVKDRVDPPPVYAALVGAEELPHGDWLMANPADDDGMAFHRGMQGLWLSDYRDLGSHRREFLAAGARAPLDPMPMVGLIGINAQMLDTRPELLGEIARAQTRLDMLSVEGPAVQTAVGARLLAQGQRTAASQITEECALLDPLCGLVHGEANSDVDAIEAIIGKVGEAPRALRSLAAAALTSRAWSPLKEAGDRLLVASPNDAAGHEILARFYAAMGDWEQGQKSARAALALGSERADILHLVAAVSMANGRPNQETVDLFEQLVVHPHLGGHANRQTALVQAAQVHVLSGDLARARELIDAALDAEAGDPNASVVLADILYKDGRHGDAETVVREIDSSSLDPAQAAMVHLWSARLYLEMGKQRMARTELEEAERNAPDWALVLEELAWAKIQSGDLVGASQAVESMVFLEPYRDRPFAPLTTGALLAPGHRRLASPMLRAMDGDVRYEEHRIAISAILAWWVNRAGHHDQLLDAIEFEGDNLALNGALALSAFDRGDWTVAAERSLAVSGRRPGLAIMHSIRGRSLAKLGRLDEAKDPLKRSTKSDLGGADLLRLAAGVWTEAGDPAAARELLEEAKAASPEDPRIRKALFALPNDKK